jgi:hypothetical protein
MAVKLNLSRIWPNLAQQRYSGVNGDVHVNGELRPALNVLNVSCPMGSVRLKKICLGLEQYFFNFYHCRLPSACVMSWDVGLGSALMYPGEARSHQRCNKS